MAEPTVAGAGALGKGVLAAAIGPLKKSQHLIPGNVIPLIEFLTVGS